MLRRLVARWRSRRDREAARAALGRCYHLPYRRELSEREQRGMLLLEQDGLLHRDEGRETHWHLTAAGRRWLASGRHGKTS